MNESLQKDHYAQYLYKRFGDIVARIMPRECYEVIYQSTAGAMKERGIINNIVISHYRPKEKENKNIFAYACEYKDKIVFAHGDKQLFDKFMEGFANE